MKRNRRNALLFSLVGLSCLFVGIFGYRGRPLTTYGSIVTGILFLLVALGMYRKKDAP